jgi:hypothetical protein
MKNVDSGFSEEKETMNRRRAILGVGGTALLPLPVLAQDGTVPAEWEERFTALEERIAAIELKLDEPLGEETPAEQTTEDQAMSNSVDVIRLSGNGTTLTEPTALAARIYRVEATVTVDNGFGDVFNVAVAGSNDFHDQIFIEFFEGNGEHEVSTSWTADREGDYSFQVDSMSGWELTFEAM